MRISVDRDGPRIVIAMADEHGDRATLDIHRRGAATLGAQLAAISGPDDEDSELECELRGRLETSKP